MGCQESNTVKNYFSSTYRVVVGSSKLGSIPVYKRRLSILLQSTKKDSSAPCLFFFIVATSSLCPFATDFHGLHLPYVRLLRIFTSSFFGCFLGVVFPFHDLLLLR